MAKLEIRIFTLDESHKVAVFDQYGARMDLRLVFAGNTDTDRGEDERYEADVPAGAYWIVSPFGESGAIITRGTASEDAASSAEFIARGGSPLKDADVAAFAGTCAAKEIPEAVAQDFLGRLTRVSSHDYMKARRH